LNEAFQMLGICLLQDELPRRQPLCGIGCLVEKSFESGRARLAYLDVPIVSLAIIESMEDDRIVVRNPKGVIQTTQDLRRF
jgi:hypothetical protein